MFWGDPEEWGKSFAIAVSLIGALAFFVIVAAVVPAPVWVPVAVVGGLTFLVRWLRFVLD